MADDIVKRLRDAEWESVLYELAADEIERLRRINAILQKAEVTRALEAVDYEQNRDRLRAALERIANFDTVDVSLWNAKAMRDIARAALAGDAKPSHPAPTGKEREPPHCPTCDCPSVPAEAAPNIAESNDRADAAPKCRLPTFKDCGVCMEYPFCGCGAQAWTDRIRVALLPYVRHTHPNCHDVKAPGSTERHGCLCGLADALAMPLVQPPAAPATEAKP